MVLGGTDSGEHARGEEGSKAKVMVQAIEYGEGQKRGGVVLCSGVHGEHDRDELRERERESEGREGERAEGAR